jgi:hypothetical protein
MPKENGKPERKIEDLTEQETADPSMGRRPTLAGDPVIFEGPWTDADEIWLECMTGEYDRRLQRESGL